MFIELYVTTDIDIYIFLYNYDVKESIHESRHP
jgi:hypothetical protein